MTSPDPSEDRCSFVGGGRRCNQGRESILHECIRDIESRSTVHGHSMMCHPFQPAKAGSLSARESAERHPGPETSTAGSLPDGTSASNRADIPLYLLPAVVG